MKTRYWINLLFLELLEYLLLGLLSQSAIALSSRQIAQQIKQITVEVKAPAISQTGVLVAQSGNTNWVLTCVPKNNSIPKSLQIITPDRQSYQFISSQIIPIPLQPSSLLLISFTSNFLYRRAILGNSQVLEEGQRVYLAGFIPLQQSSSFLFTEGMISSLSPYGFIHTSPAYTEMIGVPIFDRQGELIGLQCKVTDSRPNQVSKAELDWAIPIHTFIELAQQKGFSFGFSAFGSPPSASFP